MKHNLKFDKIKIIGATNITLSNRSNTPPRGHYFSAVFTPAIEL
jgi:hypothetical protein